MWENAEFLKVIGMYMGTTHSCTGQEGLVKVCRAVRSEAARSLKMVAAGEMMVRPPFFAQPRTWRARISQPMSEWNGYCFVSPSLSQHAPFSLF